MQTVADFRRIALSLQGAEEGSHMGAADFRVGGRSSRRWLPSQGYGNLMLTPEMQAAFVAGMPEVFLPVAGGWGRNGATHIGLAKAKRRCAGGRAPSGLANCGWKRIRKRRRGREERINKNAGRNWQERPANSQQQDGGKEDPPSERAGECACRRFNQEVHRVPGRQFPSRKYGTSLTSGAKPSPKYWAWPSGSNRERRRSAHRLCSSEA